MTGRFDYFVIFAEMRTGSNFLESNLDDLPGVACHGEAFNPVFIGYPNRDDLLGVSFQARNRDPFALLDRIIAAPGMNGFRYFHDHDPRILNRVLGDRRCAKIVLTRNPAESYISRKIAGETGQWKLTNVKHQRSAQVRFDAAEFEAHVDTLQAFQITLMRALQVTGQTAFYIDYEDLRDLEVINGLAAFLGVEGRLDALSQTLKKQNPADMAEKVSNPRAMELALARLDRFNLSRSPGFEPRRGPMVPGYRAGAKAPVLFIPVRGGPEARVLAWLAALDGVGVNDLPGGFTQKTLRQWKRQNPGHRSLCVLRHPLARAYNVFCHDVLGGGMPGLADTLRRTHDLPLPPEGGWDRDAHRAGFAAFLRFVKANLSGQSALRTAPAWATQTAILQGAAQFALPDLILRETGMETGLARLAGDLGLDAPALPPAPEEAPFPLAEIVDDAIEDAAQDAYARDYMGFGFGPWRDRR